MRIGELAAAAGISPDTVRHYERAGLLPRAPRSANGYREFPDVTLERLRVVRAALAVGFTVEELSRVLRERERGGAPCRAVRELAASKLTEVVRQERELRELRRTLTALLEDWDARLADQPAGTPVHLLAHLGHRAGFPQPRSRPRLRRTHKEKS
ncbi:MAG TPA: heavy metal-responsive transcriptional regulator [Thermoanaerobaculia bacterium]|nr:heavy metal-responsive transcriptional regulator [Thermoanaerobaculia bacterium]